MQAVEASDRGDILPTVICERDGQDQVIVVAPDMDKNLALHAANMLKFGMDPDSMIFMFDAHVAQGKRKEGQTQEEAESEFAKKYPPGSMQKMCDESGACETGEITDCIIVHRVDRAGKISMATLPYSYHGKGGPPFKWLDDFDFARGDEADGEVQMTGYIPDAIRQIISQPEAPELTALKALQDAKDFTEERCRFHSARAVMHVLTVKKYMVVDFVTPTHPEWTDCLEKGKEFVERSIAKGMFPGEAKKPMMEIVEKYIGKKEFYDEMLKLFKENSYWLPSDIRESIPMFVRMMENKILLPDLPDDITPVQEGGRVRVWNGDQSRYLGEGKYVGDVTVYAVKMPDGSITSEKNPEVEPTNPPEEGKIICLPMNPKIILDSGETVYGCQVWWEKVQERPSPSAPKYNEVRQSFSLDDDEEDDPFNPPARAKFKKYNEAK